VLLSLGLILLCQLAGEAVARGTGVPVPGPVIGLALCVMLLLARDLMIQWAPAELRDGTFEATDRGILSHLSLLFIPAGVGVVQRLDVLAGNAFTITLSVLISTILSLTVIWRGCSASLHAACMDNEAFALWVYLAWTPLLWLTVTILAYCLCDRISRHCIARRWPTRC
jgi:holin-like protein